jgi:chemotaxis protein MotB
MIRRKRHRAPTNHDRWLVSYADFITLLFAFFVVLYASAQVDQRKIGRLATAIQEAFRDLGAFPPSGAHPTDVQPSPLDALQAIQNLEQKRPTVDDKDQSSNDEDLAAVESELKNALAGEIAINAISLHRKVEGLVISLREFGFFDSGSALIRPSALPALDRIASILASRSSRLRVEGHTDNVPIHTTKIKSNWELSTARATEVVRLLIVRYGVSPERLSAAGYAHYHPVSSNETPQGRAQNRRVDIVVLSERVGRMPLSLKPPAAIR